MPLLRTGPHVAASRTAHHQNTTACDTTHSNRESTVTRCQSAARLLAVNKPTCAAGRQPLSSSARTVACLYPSLTTTPVSHSLLALHTPHQTRLQVNELPDSASATLPILFTVRQRWKHNTTPVYNRGFHEDGLSTHRPHSVRYRGPSTSHLMPTVIHKQITPAVFYM